MTYPEGVDLSRYQATDYDWAEFVIVRLGSVYADDVRREQHTTFARDRGIPLGSYWFLYDHDLISPEEQATDAYGLQIDLGLERAPHFADCEGELSTETAKRYIAEMRRLRGNCGIYSGWWIKSRGGPTLGADYGWLPEYHDTYVLPAGWTAEFTKVWQYTSSGGTLDRDRFLGTAEEMTDFFGGEMGAVDDVLKGMADAEDAAVAAGMGDPGLPPETASAYYKRGWNRVRWTVNRIRGPLAGELDVNGQAIDEIAAKAHGHSPVEVAGPAT